MEELPASCGDNLLLVTPVIVRACSSPMKIAYFSCQMPYPPHHGGLVDDWARLSALKAAGARVVLVTWYSDFGEPPPQEYIDALHTVAEVVHTLPISPTFVERIKRLVRLTRWPSHVASRIPTLRLQKQVWASLDALGPDVVWLDSVYPTVMAQKAARRYQVPMFYRSHNIEHLYFARQIARSINLRDRLAWSVNMPHLERVERETWRAAEIVFDISMDDIKTWREQGHLNGQWLPPLVQPATVAKLSASDAWMPAYDVGYLGNLRTPNNIEGVLWLLREVWPIVRQARPGLTLLVAGSSPAQVIRDAAAQAGGVTLIENAPDAAAVLRDARVLVNPALSGSGVNVKSVEMLFTQARIVSAPQGVAGLPDHVRACFNVAGDARGFAQAVLDSLDQGALKEGAELSARIKAREEFDFKRIERVLAAMQGVLSSRGHIASTDVHQTPAH